MAKALVLLSGGQDSTTSLYWAIAKWGHSNVETISFDYEQRHRIELECAARISKKANVKNTVIPINTFKALGESALVTDAPIDGHDETNQHLPASFVPGRNLALLIFAAALAYQKKINNLVIGVSEADYSGYPDCRSEPLHFLELALGLGMEWEFHLHTPLMDLTKSKTVQLAIQLGALEAMADTSTCYEGVRPPCGKCPACFLRAKGFEEAGVTDPLLNRN